MAIKKKRNHWIWLHLSLCAGGCVHRPASVGCVKIPPASGLVPSQTHALYSHACIHTQNNTHTKTTTTKFWAIQQQRTWTAAHTSSTDPRRGQFWISTSASVDFCPRVILEHAALAVMRCVCVTQKILIHWMESRSTETPPRFPHLAHLLIGEVCAAEPVSALCRAGRASSGRTKDGIIFRRGKPWRMWTTVTKLKARVRLCLHASDSLIWKDVRILCKIPPLVFWEFDSRTDVAGVALTSNRFLYHQKWVGFMDLQTKTTNTFILIHYHRRASGPGSRLGGLNPRRSAEKLAKRRDEVFASVKLAFGLKTVCFRWSKQHHVHTQTHSDGFTAPWRDGDPWVGLARYGRVKGEGVAPWC